MNLLFVAADRRELGPLLHRCTGVARAPVAADWARRGTLNGHQLLLVTNGAGRVRAQAAVDAARATFRPDAIVNTGFCGALDPALAIADIVAATAIADERHRYAVESVAAPRPCRRGVVYSCDHVAQTAAEKASLRLTGAAVVEMEAAGVAERARELDLPLYCIRAVSDLAGETFANDFNAALRKDGHFDTMRILRGAVRQPRVRVTELLRLRNRCTRAAYALGEFVAVCQF